MEALFILLIFSLVLGIGFLAAFFWAQKNGQFEDTETPALRMLFDDADAARGKQQTLNTSESKTNKGNGEQEHPVRRYHDTSRIKGVTHGS